jgi:hypothetical protein
MRCPKSQFVTISTNRRVIRVAGSVSEQCLNVGELQTVIGGYFLWRATEFRRLRDCICCDTSVLHNRAAEKLC